MKKIITLVVLVFLLVSCQQKPIKVGFVGSLSIKQSQLAVDARNALELYFDQVNEKGGVNGRNIELVVKDDFADTKEAHKAHQEFIDEGVKVVIGHLTSNMATSMLESKDEDILFVTPSIASTTLENLDDNIIRTAPGLDGQAIKYLETIQKLGYDKNLIVYDVMNKDYSEVLTNKIFKLNNSSLNLKAIPFDSRVDDVVEFIDKIDTTVYDSVFFISQAIDTAAFAQKVRMTDGDIFMMSVSWSMTADLIKNGGKSIEGMYLLGVNLPTEKSQIFLDFSEDFINRYGYEPSFVSYLAYDAAIVVVQALEELNNYSVESVKEKILEIKTFDGIFEMIELNQFGDCARSYMIYEVNDGEFKPLE